MDVNRRHCLAALGSISTAALAGCTSSIPGVGSDDPGDVVEDYVSALDDDDREAANDLIHPDAEEGEIPEDEWEFMQQFFDSVDVEILDVDEDDDEATVEAEVTFEYDDESESDEEEFELRTHDDEWLIYDD